MERSRIGRGCIGGVGESESDEAEKDEFTDDDSSPASTSTSRPMVDSRFLFLMDCAFDKALAFVA